MNSNFNERNTSEIESFKKEIEDFLKEIFKNHKSRVIEDRKIIHDAIHGTNIFYEHEIAVLDTPLLQRLRQIHQTGLSYLIFPTSLHTRFDHTLGVTILASKFIQTLNMRKDDERTYINEDPYRGDLAEVRMAALLHDCGHAFFSHLSEQHCKNYNVIRKIKENEKFVDCAAHEIISYFIVKSKFFKQWFKRNLSSNYPIKINLNLVASMIIGSYSGDKAKYFLGEIINGSMDADKLDYIQRDSFFSGIKIAVDIDRLFNTLTTFENPKNNNNNQIILKSYIPLEQIIFSKIVLYSTLYHHQKVKACDCMINSLMEYIENKLDNNGIKINGIQLNSPINFLYLCDNDLINNIQICDDDYIGKIFKDILNRNLFMRALTLSPYTISNWEEMNNCETFHQSVLTRAMASLKELNKLRDEIFDKVNLEIKNKYNLSKYQIQICLPDLPPFENDETLRTYILIKNTKTAVPLYKMFPLGEWLMAYIDKKWKGYVFCPPIDELRIEVFNKSVEVFQSKGMKFNRDMLLCESKISLTDNG